METKDYELLKSFTNKYGIKKLMRILWAEIKKFLKYPNDITIVKGRRLTDIESLNLIRGNDFDTTLLSQMEVDGFVFKNGEYVIPYINIYESSVKNNTGE